VEEKAARKTEARYNERDGLGCFIVVQKVCTASARLCHSPASAIRAQKVLLPQIRVSAGRIKEPMLRTGIYFENKLSNKLL